MAASFALSWTRSESIAKWLNKPAGRAVSEYRSRKYETVEWTAHHINEMCPEMNCTVEVFTS